MGRVRDRSIGAGLSIFLASASGGLAMGAIRAWNGESDLVFGALAGGALTSMIWARMIYSQYAPRKRLLNQVVAASVPVQLNGKQTFLSTVPFLGGDVKSRPTANKQFAWYVPYRHQVQPIRITPGRLRTYADQGWQRQRLGDSAPFARSKFFDDKWTPKYEWCCKHILGQSGCFNQTGQGARSRLVVLPHRVVEVCRRRYLD